MSSLEFVDYRDENDIPAIASLIEKDLSEPYSIFTYRYFINNWPELCLMAMSNGQCVGTIVCKLDRHAKGTMRGYIAMLAVCKSMRGRRIGSQLVQRALERMEKMGAHECILEAEVTNKAALGLYRNLGFIRAKRLHKYYLCGSDAFRLKRFFPAYNALVL